MNAARRVFFLALRELGQLIRLALVCFTLGLTTTLSVNIYSTERTKSAEFDARQAEAEVRRYELDLGKRRQEVELARIDYEKQNKRNMGSGDQEKVKSNERKKR